MVMQEVMTLKEAASYLRVRYSTLYKLVQKGKVPASKVGGAWRFRKDVLDGCLTSHGREMLRKVLVVDDDARVRELLEDIITTQGHQVVSVENGKRAVEEIEKQHFDLVFLDLVLPQLSGVEFLDKLKAQREKTFVAVITAYGDDPIALEAMSMGLLILIRKPFHIDEVVQVLDIAMKARR